MVLFVSGRQNLALVDEVNTERIEYLRFEVVADPHLGHHGNRNRALDGLDDFHVGIKAIVQPGMGGFLTMPEHRHHQGGHDDDDRHCHQ